MLAAEVCAVYVYVYLYLGRKPQLTPFLKCFSISSDLEDASLEQRIKLIKTALGCFNHWYNVPESLAAKLAGM